MGSLLSERRTLLVITAMARSTPRFFLNSPSQSMSLCGETVLPISDKFLLSEQSDDMPFGSFFVTTQPFWRPRKLG
jgi:hypothetical protein